MGVYAFMIPLFLVALVVHLVVYPIAWVLCLGRPPEWFRNFVNSAVYVLSILGFIVLVIVVHMSETGRW